MKQRFKKLIRWLNVLTILATFLAYLAPYVSPEYGWFCALFGMAFFWLLLLNLAFVIFWLSNKKLYFLFSLACIIMGWGHVRSILGFGSAETGTAEDQLSVMSFNGRSFYDFTADKSTSKAILKFLSKQQADIICFQEFPRNETHRQSVIKASGLDYVYHPKGVSLAIFSKYPITNKAIVDQGNNGAIYASIDYKGSPLNIYNVHLKSNRITDEANRVIEEKDLREKRTWIGIRSVLRKIKLASKIRADQARKIAAHLNKNKSSVILCGDFNETPQSYAYRVLSDGLQDSFCERGSGMGTTYAGKIPALRIDYVFAGDQWNILQHKILKADVSDHYPVMVELEVK